MYSKILLVDILPLLEKLKSLANGCPRVEGKSKIYQYKAIVTLWWFVGGMSLICFLSLESIPR